MAEASNFPTTLCGSSVDEAQALVRQCAEPRPVTDKVKAAILRASRRLELPFNRTRDIWYGGAKRIDAEEMDRLRRVAEKTELAHAVTTLEVLRNRMLESHSTISRQVVDGLTEALLSLEART